MNRINNLIEAVRPAWGRRAERSRARNRATLAACRIALNGCRI